MLEKLRSLNPTTTEMVLVMYVDCFEDYASAQANIAEHGAIVSHPKTGGPLPNPYVTIRDRAAKTLRGLRVRAGDLWDK